MATIGVACSDATTESSVAPTTQGLSATTTEPLPDLPMDDRSQLTRRLAAELDDEALATTVVAGLDDGTVEALVVLADGDIAASPALSYTPSTVPADEVDSLWVFSYGYRFAPGVDAEAVQAGGAVPAMSDLAPGPTNEELARLAAEFVDEHPVPIIAQWEVARILDDMGVANVISVEPDIAPDGTVTYLSTAGVAAKGLTLARDAGIDPGHAGVLCFADHAVRCLLTARAAGLTADVPEGVDLPSEYDPESGQAWTRNRSAWVPIDLLGRGALAR
jgi:hypothetical protein